MWFKCLPEQKSTLFREREQKLKSLYHWQCLVRNQNLLDMWKNGKILPLEKGEDNQ